MLDGRDFDVTPWSAADNALTTLVARVEAREASLRGALDTAMADIAAIARDGWDSSRRVTALKAISRIEDALADSGEAGS